jgi:hypothetical protein
VLQKELGLIVFYLSWVPYTLDAGQKTELVNLSRQFLAMLRPDEKDDFISIVTEEESWFFIETSGPYDRSGPRNDLPSRPKQNIQMRKCLISII